MILVRISISLSGASLLSAVRGFNNVTIPLNETEVVTEVHKQILPVFGDNSKVSESSSFACIQTIVPAVICKCNLFE